MIYEINNIKLSIDSNNSELVVLTALKLGVNVSDCKNLKIIKESIDARNKNNISFIYTVQVEVDGEVPITLCSDIKPFVLQSKKLISLGTEKIFNRPVIIGSGPAGLFAALKLSTLNAISEKSDNTKQLFKTKSLSKGQKIEEPSSPCSLTMKKPKQNYIIRVRCIALMYEERCWNYRKRN